MRKKIYLLNRHFQFRFMGMAVVVGLFSTLLTTIIILYPLYAFRILRIPEFLPLSILGVMVAAALVNIALISFMTIMLTHRIVGPLYNLVRNMRRFESPNWNGHIRVRGQDELKYVVRNFNNMIDCITASINNDLTTLKKIEDRVPELQTVTASMEERLQDFHSLHPVKDTRDL